LRSSKWNSDRGASTYTVAGTTRQWKVADGTGTSIAWPLLTAALTCASVVRRVFANAALVKSTGIGSQGTLKSPPLPGGAIDAGLDRRSGTRNQRAMIGTVVGWYMSTLERADERRCTDRVDGDVERNPRCRVCLQGSVDGWSEPKRPDRTSSQKCGKLVKEETKGEKR